MPMKFRQNSSHLGFCIHNNTRHPSSTPPRPLVFTRLRRFFGHGRREAEAHLLARARRDSRGRLHKGFQKVKVI